MLVNCWQWFDFVLQRLMGGAEDHLFSYWMMRRARGFGGSVGRRGRNRPPFWHTYSAYGSRSTYVRYDYGMTHVLSGYIIHVILLRNMT